MSPDQILQWYADWTASDAAHRAAVNETLADLGLEPLGATP